MTNAPIDLDDPVSLWFCADGTSCNVPHIQNIRPGDFPDAPDLTADCCGTGGAFAKYNANKEPI